MYRGGYAAVAEALLKITPEELDAKPGPGRWSVREIVHHLADSEMTAAVAAAAAPRAGSADHSRLRSGRVRAAAVLRSAARDVARTVPVGGESTAEILDRLTPAEWVREGTHTEAGPYGVEAWLKTYAEHAHKHARQIREARAAVKK